MIYRKVFWALNILLVVGFAVGQQEVPRPIVKDSRATAVASQVLKTAGLSSLSSLNQGFLGQGMITYHWAGEEVQGNVTIRGRGVEQIRLDADLPNGSRSWIVNRGNGMRKEAGTPNETVPHHNAVNLASQTFPVVALANRLRDPNCSLSYLGITPKGGIRTFHIRTKPSYPADPNGSRGEMSTIDFFVDPSTLTIVDTEAKLHPRDSSTDSFTREVSYGDYRTINGILTPFMIIEHIDHQPVSEIRLSNVSLSPVVSDSDFHFE